MRDRDEVGLVGTAVGQDGRRRRAPGARGPGRPAGILLSNLRALRIERNMSQEDLAGLTGRHRNTIQRAESGGGADWPTAAAIAAALGVKIGALTGEA